MTVAYVNTAISVALPTELAFQDRLSRSRSSSEDSLPRGAERGCVPAGVSFASVEVESGALASPDTGVPSWPSVAPGTASTSTPSA